MQHYLLHIDIKVQGGNILINPLFLLLVIFSANNTAVKCSEIVYLKCNFACLRKEIQGSQRSIDSIIYRRVVQISLNKKFTLSHRIFWTCTKSFVYYLDRARCVIIGTIRVFCNSSWVIKILDNLNERGFFLISMLTLHSIIKIYVSNRDTKYLQWWRYQDRRVLLQFFLKHAFHMGLSVCNISREY